MIYYLGETKKKEPNKGGIIMGKRKIKLLAAIPAAVVGIVCATIGAASGTETSKKLILEKGGDALCSVVKRK